MGNLKLSSSSSIDVLTPFDFVSVLRGNSFSFIILEVYLIYYLYFIIKISIYGVPG